MLEIRLEARLNNKGTEDVLLIGESLCVNVGGENLKIMVLRIFNSSHVINKRRSTRLVIGFLSYAASATNKIVEKGKRAVVTGMSLLCSLGRTHCILNRHCFVFRACAGPRPDPMLFHVGCLSKRSQCKANSGEMFVKLYTSNL